LDDPHTFLLFQFHTALAVTTRSNNNFSVINKIKKEQILTRDKSAPQTSETIGRMNLKYVDEPRFCIPYL
jgi:hypothetical protein